MIEVEAAQIILVGFALTAVLRDDETGHRLQHLAGPDDGPILELLRTDVPLRCGIRDADLRIATFSDDDFGQSRRGVAVGARRSRDDRAVRGFGVLRLCRAANRASESERRRIEFSERNGSPGQATGPAENHRFFLLHKQNLKWFLFFVLHWVALSL